MFTSEGKLVTISQTILSVSPVQPKSQKPTDKILSADLLHFQSETIQTIATRITTRVTCSASKLMSQKSTLKEKREAMDNLTRSRPLLRNTQITTILLSLGGEARGFNNSRYNNSKSSNRLHESFNSYRPSLQTVQLLTVNSFPMMIYSELPSL